MKRTFVLESIQLTQSELTLLLEISLKESFAPNGSKDYSKEDARSLMGHGLILVLPEKEGAAILTTAGKGLLKETPIYLRKGICPDENCAKRLFSTSAMRASEYFAEHFSNEKKICPHCGASCFGGNWPA